MKETITEAQITERVLTSHGLSRDEARANLIEEARVAALQAVPVEVPAEAPSQSFAVAVQTLGKSRSGKDKKDGTEAKA